jgi:hypothetical protein
MLRPTISRSVCLGIKQPCAAQDQVFITVRQLRICWGGASSPTRGESVVYNCCSPSPAQSFKGPSPAGLMTIFYCLRIKIPSTWSEIPIFITPQERGGPVISPGTLFFSPPPTTRRSTVEVFEPTSKPGLTSVTDWLHFTNCAAYNISARTTQKTPFLCCCIQLLPCKHACLRSRYLLTAVVYLLISRS